MAAHYIAEIRTVQPKGPYYLGGRCLGAYISLEMANQLLAQGERVGLLAILDSYWAPAKPLTAGKKLGKHVQNLKTGGIGEKLSYLVAHAGIRLGKTRIALIGLASEFALRMRRPVPARLRETYIDQLIPRINGQAELRYRPALYPGIITFFQATAEVERDPRAFWGKLTSEGIEVETVPATHKDILVEPNVAVLAAELREALEKARARAS